MRFDRTLSAAALAISGLCSTAQVSAATEFFFTSSPQSWIGQGQTVSVTPAMGFTFIANVNFAEGVSFWVEGVAPPEFPIVHWWSLDFSGPDRTPLTVGVYPGAVRLSVQGPGQPGLDFSGNGRGNNTLTGWFEVLEIEISPQQTVASFAADFIQYDEGSAGAWNVGAIRFNSTVPITVVPEPASILLLSLGAVAVLGLVRRRQRAGHGPSGGQLA